VWSLATDLRPSECPSKTRTSLPLSTSHNRAVPSALPVSTCLPSGENVADDTSRECPSCTTKCMCSGQREVAGPKTSESGTGPQLAQALVQIIAFSVLRLWPWGFGLSPLVFDFGLWTAFGLWLTEPLHQMFHPSLENHEKLKAKDQRPIQKSLPCLPSNRRLRFSSKTDRPPREGEIAFS
jgi:hypothetical protein